MTGERSASILRHGDALGWQLAIPPTVDPRRPGIVEWRIDGGGSTMVRATVIARAIQQYEDSVWRLRQGLPHRVGAYRAIHHALAAAAERHACVIVLALENCDAADLAARKAHWIAQRGTLGGAD